MSKETEEAMYEFIEKLKNPIFLYECQKTLEKGMHNEGMSFWLIVDALSEKLDDSYFHKIYLSNIKIWNLEAKLYVIKHINKHNLISDILENENKKFIDNKSFINAVLPKIKSKEVLKKLLRKVRTPELYKIIRDRLKECPNSISFMFD